MKHRKMCEVSLTLRFAALARFIAGLPEAPTGFVTYL
jgi:hypothetical protein